MGYDHVHEDRVCYIDLIIQMYMVNVLKVENNTYHT